MSDKLLIQLSTTQVQMEPGGTPYEMVATIQNNADSVDQYTLEVSGLDQEWYTAPVTSFTVFPQDREQVRISLHPPRRPDVKAGSHQFRVLVRARAGAQESADAVLELRGTAVYRIDLTPRQMSGRGEGRYQLRLFNTGDADIQLGLEGADADAALKVSFPGHDDSTVRVVSNTEIPVLVRPDKRPLVGREKAYSFSITARPLDAAGDPQTVSAQFTYRPMFASLAPLRAFGIVAVIAIALLAIVAVVVSSGFVQGAPQRVSLAMGSLKGAACNVPIVGGLCPREEPSLAAQSLPVEGPCVFEFGFKEFAQAEPKLIGDCTSNVAYDRFGNGVQYTKLGTLFWQKESNTVYFFRGDSLWAYIQGRSQLLRGSGAT